MIRLFKRKPGPALELAEEKRELERKLKARGYSNSEAKREVSERYAKSEQQAESQ